MRFILFAVFSLLFISENVTGQSDGFAFGVKLGPTVGLQRYNGFQRDPLWTFHAAGYIESLSADNSNAFIAQLGYHGRGSAVRVNSYVFNGQVFPSRTFKTKFNNASLMLGVKQKFDLGYDKKWYYLLGLRVEYNLSREFDLFNTNESTVKEFTYGFTAGGGIEWMLSDLAGGIIELSVAPDLSNQIYVPPQPSPFNPNRLLSESNVKNISFELSIGIRLLNRYEYYD